MGRTALRASLVRPGRTAPSAAEPPGRIHESEGRHDPDHRGRGCVHHLEGLQGLGQIQRARWGVLAPYAARRPADLVVVGRSSAGVDPVAVIAALKDTLTTAGIPVLHVAPHESGCADCRADVCLSDVPVAGQLARVARVLIELGGARGVGPCPGAGAGPGALRASGGPGSPHRRDRARLQQPPVRDDPPDRAGPAPAQPDHPAFARLAPALDAAERAAALEIRRAAARLRPRLARGSLPADLDAVVEQLDHMLQRVVGELPVAGPRRPGAGACPGRRHRDGAAHPEPSP